MGSEMCIRDRLQYRTSSTCNLFTCVPFFLSSFFLFPSVFHVYVVFSFVVMYQLSTVFRFSILYSAIYRLSMVFCYCLHLRTLILCVCGPLLCMRGHDLCVYGLCVCSVYVCARVWVCHSVVACWEGHVRVSFSYICLNGAYISVDG